MKRIKLDKQAALNLAYRLLIYRLRSRWELENRLKSKGFPSDVVRDVIDELQRQGLVDDLEFAKQFVISGISKLKSPPRLKAELIRKFRVPSETVDKAIDEAFDWDEVAKLIKRKAQRLEKMGYTRRKIVGYFVRKGFDVDFVRDVLETDG